MSDLRQCTHYSPGEFIEVRKFFVFLARHQKTLLLTPAIDNRLRCPFANNSQVRSSVVSITRRGNTSFFSESIPLTILSFFLHPFSSQSLYHYICILHNKKRLEL
ncbi:unnamed protein product [Acanthoscelides obtectus]|uniref:Uncharacterized protein n=1 Tax=Acanthoscelides obtectus TaxID=200917 RepID=A0A9P0L1S8_ACAOB|nr:unnamed protein product [Acanthoscelides obtectus]CAK1675361.1 hypothetical protein AOBTE_LOCUS30164 [Acanthoscelides obtectus]